MAKDQKHCVYMHKNKINNKIYIGVHQTKDVNVFDGYIGCGVYINRPASYKKSKTPFQHAVNKYGIDKFKQYLLVFGIHLPGFHNENLIKFEEGNVFEQLSELFNSFVMKNVKLKK